MSASGTGAVFFLGSRAHYQVLEQPNVYDIENGNTSTETIYSTSVEELWPNETQGQDLDPNCNALPWNCSDQNDTVLYERTRPVGCVKRRGRGKQSSSEALLGEDVRPAALNKDEDLSEHKPKPSQRQSVLSFLSSLARRKRRLESTQVYLQHLDSVLNTCTYRESCRCLDCQVSEHKPKPSQRQSVLSFLSSLARRKRRLESTQVYLQHLDSVLNTCTYRESCRCLDCQVSEHKPKPSQRQSVLSFLSSLARRKRRLESTQVYLQHLDSVLNTCTYRESCRCLDCQVSEHKPKPSQRQSVLSFLSSLARRKRRLESTQVYLQHLDSVLNTCTYRESCRCLDCQVSEHKPKPSQRQSVLSFLSSLARRKRRLESTQVYLQHLDSVLNTCTYRESCRCLDCQVSEHKPKPSQRQSVLSFLSSLARRKRRLESTQVYLQHLDSVLNTCTYRESCRCLDCQVSEHKPKPSQRQSVLSFLSSLARRKRRLESTQVYLQHLDSVLNTCTYRESCRCLDCQVSEHKPKPSQRQSVLSFLSSLARRKRRLESTQVYLQHLDSVLNTCTYRESCRCLDCQVSEHKPKPSQRQSVLSFLSSLARRKRRLESTQVYLQHLDSVLNTCTYRESCRCLDCQVSEHKPKPSQRQSVLSFLSSLARRKRRLESTQVYLQHLDSVLNTCTYRESCRCLDCQVSEHKPKPSQRQSVLSFLSSLARRKRRLESTQVYLQHLDSVLNTCTYRESCRCLDCQVSEHKPKPSQRQSVLSFLSSLARRKRRLESTQVYLQHLDSVLNTCTYRESCRCLDCQVSEHKPKPSQRQSVLSFLSSLARRKRRLESTQVYLQHLDSVLNTCTYRESCRCLDCQVSEHKPKPSQRQSVLSFLSSLARRKRRLESTQVYLQHLDSVLNTCTYRESCRCLDCQVSEHKPKPSQRQSVLSFLSSLARRKRRLESTQVYLQHLDSVLNTCTYRESCRCLDCQGRYFECAEESDDYSSDEEFTSYKPESQEVDSYGLPTLNDDDDEVFLDPKSDNTSTDLLLEDSTRKEERTVSETLEDVETDKQLQMEVAASTSAMFNILLYHPFSCSIQ